MKKKLSVLILLNVFILLSVFNANAQIKSEIELSFTGAKTIYANTRETLYGTRGRIFIGDKFSFLNIYGAITKNDARSGINGFNKNWLKIEIEGSLWWKWLVFTCAFDFREEKEKLFIFKQPDDIVILEKWHESELIAGLGLKVGDYTRSFARIAATVGRSFYGKKDELLFVDLLMKDNFDSLILGGSIKAKLAINPENKRTKSQVIPIWIDLRADYSNRLDSKYYRLESTLGLGIRVIKNFGIRGAVTGIQTRTIEFTKYCNYSANLVLIF